MVKSKKRRLFATHDTILYRESGVDRDVSLAYPPCYCHSRIMHLCRTPNTVPSEKRRVEQPANANAILVLEDGTVYWGHGIGLETILLAKSALTHQ